jgi:hypothetical protein
MVDLSYDGNRPVSWQNRVPRVEGGASGRCSPRPVATALYPIRCRNLRRRSRIARSPYVVPGRKAIVDFTAANGEAREVTIVAAEEPANFLVRAVQVLDQIAGILVVSAAAWLVWTRPGGMSRGFFLYVLWFPGA